MSYTQYGLHFFISAGNWDGQAAGYGDSRTGGTVSPTRSAAFVGRRGFDIPKRREQRTGCRRRSYHNRVERCDEEKRRLVWTSLGRRGFYGLVLGFMYDTHLRGTGPRKGKRDVAGIQHLITRGLTTKKRLCTYELIFLMPTASRAGPIMGGERWRTVVCRRHPETRRPGLWHVRLAWAR